MAADSFTPINSKDLLTAVKNSLNISGTHFDTTLQLYIDEVKEYLRSAGVLEIIIASTIAVGCISRGVADLWNYGNGDTTLSDYFYQRAEQLRVRGLRENADSVDGEYITYEQVQQIVGGLVANAYTSNGTLYLLNAENEIVGAVEIPVDSPISTAKIDEFFEQ